MSWLNDTKNADGLDKTAREALIAEVLQEVVPAIEAYRKRHDALSKFETDHPNDKRESWKSLKFYNGTARDELNDKITIALEKRHFNVKIGPQDWQGILDQIGEEPLEKREEAESILRSEAIEIMLANNTLHKEIMSRAFGTMQQAQNTVTAGDIKKNATPTQGTDTHLA